MRYKEIDWYFEEWAEKDCNEAFLTGFCDKGYTYETIGIMGGGEIQEVKEIELTEESKAKLALDLAKESLVFGHKLKQTK